MSKAVPLNMRAAETLADLINKRVKLMQWKRSQTAHEGIVGRDGLDRIDLNANEFDSVVCFLLERNAVALLALGFAVE
jgi:hypothetical protein